MPVYSPNGKGHVAPLAIDLCCGLGGWTEGLLSEGWRVIGYDIEAHEYGDEKYPGELRLKSILDLHGSELADADLIVASPPCQAYSYMAMPWSLAKAKAVAIRADETGQMLADLNALFNACFRIQREASEAAGRHIPMVVENVKGAQPWVGKAAWNFGSYYLWGDVPALMPGVIGARKNNGGSWFNIGSPGQTETNRNPVHNHAAEARKNPGFRFDGSGKSFQTESVERHVEGKRYDATEAAAEGRKQRGSGREWFAGEGTIGRTTSSKSPARKAASAKIAKIPLALSTWIGRCYLPRTAEAAA